jgi:basic amino acid/polyamine antiporter, APA family
VLHSSFLLLFRRKSIDQLRETADKKHLLRTLGAPDILFMGIGAIIGTGIFVPTGVAAARYAGPGIIFSFVIAGLACALVALIYSELACMVPVSGSTYTYAYAAPGEIIAWVVGWDLILEYTVAVGVVSTGRSSYVADIFRAGGIGLPQALIAAPADGGIINLPAALIPLLIGLLLILGTRESATINRIIVFVKLVAIGIFVFLAAPMVNPAHWSPLLPYGLTGILSGASIIFAAYLGLDAVSTTAEECNNVKRDAPVGIICSLLVCTVLYVIVAALLTGLVPYARLDHAEPVSYVLSAVGYRLGSAIVAVGAVASITTVLLVPIFGQTRVAFAMARDGFLPTWVSKIHPRFGTPYAVTLVTAVAGAVSSAFTPIQVLAELVNIVSLFAFLVAAVGVFVLRYRMPAAPRPFRCPPPHPHRGAASGSSSTSAMATGIVP